MTANTTEQERALADLRHLYAQMVGGLVKDSAQAKRIADGILSRAIQKLEQAARRAPAVPVPQGWKLVPEKSTEAMARAFRADDAPWYFCMTTLRCADFAERYAAALAAAPQPPEADHIAEAGKMVEAPVQLPEPAGWIDDGGMVFWNDGRKPNDGEIIYTEHQVRQLLAAHGIKEQST